jgi:hypothetical protein
MAESPIEELKDPLTESGFSLAGKSIFLASPSASHGTGWFSAEDSEDAIKVRIEKEASSFW